MRKLLNKLFGASSSDAPSTPSNSNQKDALDHLKSQINQALAKSQFEIAEELLNTAIALEENNLSLRSNRAFALLQLGRAAEAEDVLRVALHIDANDVDTLYMLAGVLRSKGDAQGAIETYQHIIQVQSQFLLAYHDLARLLLDMAQVEAAQQIIATAIEVLPLSAELQLLRAEAFHRTGKLQEALADYLSVLGTTESNQERPPASTSHLMIAHFRLAQIYSATGDAKAAIRHAESYLKHHPQHPDSLLIIGRSHMQCGATEQALAVYQQVLALAPQAIEALANSGACLQQLGRFDEALEKLDAALSLDPHSAAIWHNKGRIAYDQKDFTTSLAALEQAARLAPQDPTILHHLGLSLTGLERYEEAIFQYDRAISLDPQHPFAYFDRGKTSLRLERYAQAIKDIEYSLKIHPELPEAQLELGFALLATGDLERGFKQYEWRWRCSPFKEKIRPFTRPAWDGHTALSGKRVLLCAEQGLGDSIQFARYAPMLAKMGAEVILEVQGPLVPLFKHLNGVKQVIAQGEILPDSDFHAPLMSLPFYCQTNAQNIPQRASYYDLDVLKRAARSNWRDLLKPSERKKIGIVWAGSRDFVHDKKRSVPFETFEKILSADADFYCLQKEIHDADLLALNKHGIPFFGHDLHDLLETAALIAEMDIVITVDTSIAHLAGSLGKPVWIMLPFNPDWRWMLERRDTPWYPSARLFRQRTIYQWESVIDQITTELQDFL